MKEQRNPQLVRQEYSDSLRQLVAAVNKPAIGELIDPIVREEGLDRTASWQAWKESLDKIITLANLGDQDALRILISIGYRAAAALADLVNELPAECGAATTGTDSRPSLRKEDKSQEHWLNEANQAAEKLTETLKDKKQGARFQERLRDEVQSMPTSRFSIPLEILCKAKEPPANPEKLVGDLTDRLVEQRISKVRKRNLLSLIESSWEWPTVISSYDYKKNRRLSEILPELPLGSNTALDLLSKNVMSGGPSMVALHFFNALEEERQKTRSNQHLTELKEANPPTINELIRDAERHKGSQRKLRRGAGSIWTVCSLWRREAALLPGLESDSVSTWADAAFALAASLCDGDFENYTWPKSVEDRAVPIGSKRATLKRVIKEGFTELASNIKIERSEN